MINSKNKPQIFKKNVMTGWEEQRLDALCEVFTDGDWIEAKDQSKDGIRLVQTGNVGVAKYLDKEKSAKWVSEDTFNRLKCREIYEGDILISRLPEPAGRACIMPNLGTRMITAVDCTIARTMTEVSSLFLVQYLSTPKYFKEVNMCLAGGTRQRISRGNLAAFMIPIPLDVTEQDFIGSFLRDLDSIISIHEQECNRLECLRLAMLDKMFPQNGRNVPVVRFKQFTDPWINKPFSEIFIERHIIDTVSEDYPQLSFTIEEGVIRPEDRKTNKRDFLILDKANKKYLQTEYDDIIYNPANVIYGAIHRNGLGKGCVSPIYKIFYTEQDSTFMECIVRHPRFINAISRSMEGTVKKLKTLKPEAFLKMSAYIAPTLDEQILIGQYFAQMDKLIEIEKEEIEKIQHIKSACLEKMFV